jgi:hypothetical protein
VPPIPNVRVRAAIVLAALSAIAWRLLAVPPGRWWRDWVLLLSAYAAYTLFRRDSRHWPMATATLMAFLLGIYIQGQARHVWALLGMGP